MSRGVLELTILGSGTSTGVPVIGCRCPVCSSASPRDHRTRASALVSWQGKNLLLDTATDFRQQALREGIDRIDAVLFTHAHADHVHGIDDLRVFSTPESPAIPIYGSRETMQVLHRVFAYIFAGDPEPGFIPRLEPVTAEEPFELFGLPVQPVPLLHGGFPSQGYRMGPLAYLTDCSAIPDESWPLLEGIEVLVIDGLRFRPHKAHFNIPQAVEAAERAGAKRTLLTHLSHEVDHHHHSPLLPPGIELAYDGQRLTLPLRGV